MSLEPFVYLFVLLLLTAMVLIGRWLNEKVREEINLRGLFEPADTPQETTDQRGRGTPTSRREVPKPPTGPSGPPNRRLRLKMALHNKKDLRQGIVLMTVLGPCRALEPPSSS